MITGRVLAFFLLLAVRPTSAQTNVPSYNEGDRPRDVTFCDLSRDPGGFNHARVKITAFVTYGFENFHLADPSCHTQGFSVWVMYGGKALSGTPYCCPGEGGSKDRSDVLNIEGVEVQLVEDSNYQGFRGLLNREHDTIVRMTAQGRFFSGEKQTIDGRTSWGGAGHFGCCSLFVVEKVEWFAQHARGDLDYTAEAGYYEKEGCKFGQLSSPLQVAIEFPEGTADQAIAQQHEADDGKRDWAFADPERVALESLKDVYPGQVPILQRTKSTPARNVYRWSNGRKHVIAVVTRPYWLSFYSSSKTVAWVTTAIKEAECN